MLNVNYPDGANSLGEQLLTFHDWLMMFVISISSTTLYAMSKLWGSYSNRALLDSQVLESLWTLVPIVILLAIALPSLRLLYMADSETGPHNTVKALGHQWYWQYDYPTGATESYLVRNTQYRLLEVDHRLISPVEITLQMLVSAADVLHSWTIPTISVKADAVPGRVNKLIFTPKRPGVYYGQCREICGSNHSFIPITMECFFNQTIALKAIKSKVKKYLSLAAPVSFFSLLHRS